MIQVYNIPIWSCKLLHYMMHIDPGEQSLYQIELYYFHTDKINSNTSIGNIFLDTNVKGGRSEDVAALRRQVIFLQN